MYIIFPSKKSASEAQNSDVYEFLKQVETVLQNTPDTWKQYSEDYEGACKILEMEYCELKKVVTLQHKKEESIHLALACFNLWRTLNAQSI